MKKFGCLVDILLGIAMTIIVATLSESVGKVLENIANYLLLVILVGVPLWIIGLILYKIVTNPHSKEVQKLANAEYKRDLKERPWRFK